MKFKIKLLILITILSTVGFFYKDHFFIYNGSISFYFNKHDVPYLEDLSDLETAKQNKNQNNNSNEKTSKKENAEINQISKNSSNDNVVVIDYGFYQLNYNCDKGGFDNFSYTTVPDSGNLDRYGSFHYDDQVGKLCNYSNARIRKAKNTKTYKSPSRKHAQYDRGHGTHQNIWDHDKNLMKETNYMANIVPQEKNQNRRGLWRLSEETTECYRDLDTVKVVGGNIWGNDSSNDYFVKSHGVVTPDYLFKIILINNEPYSFIIPNTSEVTRDNYSNYMVSISDIENKTGYTFDFNDNIKSIVNKTLPKKPSNCSIK